MDELYKESAIRCAYLDLVGVLEAFEKGDPLLIDRDAIALTISELSEAFPELQKV